jgi:Tol biopolymer transport system component
MRRTIGKLAFITIALTTLLTAGAVVAGLLLTPEGNVLAVRATAPTNVTEKFYTLLDVGSGIKRDANDVFGCAWQMDFNPDGRRAVYANCEGNMDFYLVENGNRVSFSPMDNQSQHIYLIRDFTWGENGQAAFIGLSTGMESDSDVYVWDGVTARDISQNILGDYDPTWSADGRIAFSSEDNALRVWTGTEVVTISDSEHGSFDWSPDGKLAFVAWEGNDEIEVWDGKQLVNISQNSGQDSDPAWGPGGQLAFMSERDGKPAMYIWKDENLTHIPAERVFWHPHPVWSHDGRLAFPVAISDFSDFAIAIWDGQTLSYLDDFYGEFEDLQWINMRWK